MSTCTVEIVITSQSSDIFLSCLFAELHNEELNDLYSSPNIVRVIKLTRMGWAEHVARMGGEERRMHGFGGDT